MEEILKIKNNQEAFIFDVFGYTYNIYIYPHPLNHKDQEIFPGATFTNHQIKRSTELMIIIEQIIQSREYFRQSVLRWMRVDK